jgi:hypothetical protein
MKVRNKEINRRQIRRNKTRWLKDRIKAATDSKMRAKLTEKLRRINPYLTDVK